MFWGSELPLAEKPPSGRGVSGFPLFKNCLPLPRASLHRRRHLGSSVSRKQEISLYVAACSCELCLQILDKRTPCEGDFRPHGHLRLCFQRPSCLMREQGRAVPRGLRGLAPASRLVRAGAAGPHQVLRKGLAVGVRSRPLSISWIAKGTSEYSPMPPSISIWLLSEATSEFISHHRLINSTPVIHLWSVMNIQSSKYVIWMLC